MDLVSKLMIGLFIAWSVAMVIALLIVLMPVILAVAAFFLMIGLLTLIGRLVSSWIGY